MNHLPSELWNHNVSLIFTTFVTYLTGNTHLVVDFFLLLFGAGVVDVLDVEVVVKFSKYGSS